MNNTTVMKLLDTFAKQVDDHDDHDHASESVDKTQINIAKGVTMLVLFCASMIFGLIPFKLSKWYNWTDPNKDARTNAIVSTLLSFGGGVLLATTFLHLLPEISEQIVELQSDGRLPNWEFSIANLLMGIGFFIIYFVEELVHAYLHRHQRRMQKIEDAFVRGHSPRESLKVARSKIQEHQREPKSATISTVDLVENNHHHGHVDHSHADHSHHHHDYHEHHSHNHHNHSHLPAMLTTNSQEDVVVSSIRGLLIVLALSVHELFEGLAVGLQSTTTSVWYMFGAVAAHKLVIAFCIGVELMVTKTRTWLAILYVFVFAIVSPMGIGVGIILSNADNAEVFEVASVILQGLASGTLLYVIFFEILSKHKSGFLQYLAVLVGYFLMFGLKFIGGHGHSHGTAAEESHDDGHGHSHNH
ncbi:unnamed protein product [Diamesa serratosioi]